MRIVELDNSLLTPNSRIVELDNSLLTPNSRSYLNRWIQPDSIIPNGVQGLDRYAYANNNPLRYTDPTGHNFWDTISDFTGGVVSEVLKANFGFIPQVNEALTANGSETQATTAGRIVGDVINIAIGVVEIGAGLTIGTGGTAVSCGVTLCIGAVVTVGTAAVVTSAGVTIVASGAVGLGSNLSLITKNDNSGSELKFS